jgi:hypothetical protein
MTYMYISLYIVVCLSACSITSNGARLILYIATFIQIGPRLNICEQTASGHSGAT